MPDSPGLPRKPFWFLRHGQTDYNRDGLAQGRVDIPLNETGRAQARDAAALLADRGITAIFCSPLRRARQTAAIVNETLHLPTTFEPELREAAYGEMESQPMAEWFHGWIAGGFTPVGGESFAELGDRVARVMASILQSPGLALIVAHGSLFRALRRQMGLPHTLPTPNGQPLYCEPVDEASQTGSWRIDGLVIGQP